MKKEILKIFLLVDLVAIYFTNLICVCFVEPLEILEGNIIMWVINIIVCGIVELIDRYGGNRC